MEGSASGPTPVSVDMVTLDPNCELGKASVLVYVHVGGCMYVCVLVWG